MNSMSICNSLFLGYEGIYNFGNYKIQFRKKSCASYRISGNWFNDTLSDFLNSYTFRVLTFSYLHVFVHEMGHVLAIKILTGYPSTIIIDTHTVAGKNNSVGLCHLTPRKNSIVAISGPLVSVIFSMTKIYAALAWRSFITTPLAIGIVSTGGIWVFGELFYMVHSILNQDGDFADIARQGPAHLRISIVTMVGVVALGMLKIAISL